MGARAIHNCINIIDTIIMDGSKSDPQLLLLLWMEARAIHNAVDIMDHP